MSKATSKLCRGEQFTILEGSTVYELMKDVFSNKLLPEVLQENFTQTLITLRLSIYIKLKSCLSVCLSDGHAGYSPHLARIDIVCADNEALIIRLL